MGIAGEADYYQSSTSGESAYNNESEPVGDQSSFDLWLETQSIYRENNLSPLAQLAREELPGQVEVGDINQQVKGFIGIDVIGSSTKSHREVANSMANVTGTLVAELNYALDQAFQNLEANERPRLLVNDLQGDYAGLLLVGDSIAVSSLLVTRLLSCFSHTARYSHEINSFLQNINPNSVASNRVAVGLNASAFTSAERDSNLEQFEIIIAERSSVNQGIVGEIYSKELQEKLEIKEPQQIGMNSNFARVRGSDSYTQRQYEQDLAQLRSYITDGQGQLTIELTEKVQKFSEDKVYWNSSDMSWNWDNQYEHQIIDASLLLIKFVGDMTAVPKQKLAQFFATLTDLIGTDSDLKLAISDKRSGINVQPSVIDLSSLMMRSTFALKKLKYIDHWEDIAPHIRVKVGLGKTDIVNNPFWPPQVSSGDLSRTTKAHDDPSQESDQILLIGGSQINLDLGSNPQLEVLPGTYQGTLLLEYLDEGKKNIISKLTEPWEDYHQSIIIMAQHLPFLIDFFSTAAGASHEMGNPFMNLDKLDSAQLHLLFTQWRGIPPEEGRRKILSTLNYTSGVEIERSANTIKDLNPKAALLLDFMNRAFPSGVSPELLLLLVTSSSGSSKSDSKSELDYWGELMCKGGVVQSPTRLGGVNWIVDPNLRGRTDFGIGKYRYEQLVKISSSKRFQELEGRDKYQILKTISMLENDIEVIGTESILNENQRDLLFDEMHKIRLEFAASEYANGRLAVPEIEQIENDLKENRFSPEEILLAQGLVLTAAIIKGEVQNSYDYLIENREFKKIHSSKIVEPLVTGWIYSRLAESGLKLDSALQKVYSNEISNLGYWLGQLQNYSAARGKQGQVIENQENKDKATIIEQVIGQISTAHLTRSEQDLAWYIIGINEYLFNPKKGTRSAFLPSLSDEKRLLMDQAIAKLSNPSLAARRLTNHGGGENLKENILSSINAVKLALAAVDATAFDAAFTNYLYYSSRVLLEREDSTLPKTNLKLDDLEKMITSIGRRRMVGNNPVMLVHALQLYSLVEGDEARKLETIRTTLNKLELSKDLINIMERFGEIKSKDYPFVRAEYLKKKREPVSRAKRLVRGTLRQLVQRL